MENEGFQKTFVTPFEIDSSLAAKMRVLIVDDDSSLADFLGQFLEEMKFRVEIVSSGEEALSVLDRIGEVDMALVDFRLPGMDGLETIKRIREISPDTVTMVITGLPTLDSSIRAMRLGASDYILKPFNLNDVATAVRKAMKEREIKFEIKKLKEKVAAIEKNQISSGNIDIRENIGETGKISISGEDGDYPDSAAPSD
jgi:two-component system nitrogen regulation response regulator NtrX